MNMFICFVVLFRVISACTVGNYQQPYPFVQCLSSCPTGYTPDDSTLTCIGTPGIVVDYVLDSITPIILDKHRGWPAQNGNTLSYFPPNFETTDPIPAKNRGYYFNGISTNLRALPLGSMKVPILGVQGALLVWAMPFSLGGLFFSTNNLVNAHTMFTLQISGGCAYVRFNGDQTFGSIPITANQWHSFFVTYWYNTVTTRTIIQIYVDLVLDVTNGLTFNLKMSADPNGYFNIGMGMNPGPTLLYFFEGYIWQVKLYNYYPPLSVYQNEVLGPGQPASAIFTLSTCLLNEYIDPLGNCVACQGGCTACIDGNSCSLCEENLCAYCTSFDHGTCATCKSNASLVGITCACNFGYYYDPVSFSCATCDPTCNSCSAGGPYNCLSCKARAQLQFSGTGPCVCMTGYYPFPHAGNCGTCDSVCLTCQGTPTQCTSCKGAAVISGGASFGSCICPSNSLPSSSSDFYCQCPTGFTLSLLNQKCISCDPLCLSCTDTNACSKCRNHAHMKDGMCICDTGSWLYSHTTTLSYCAKRCKSCSEAQYFLVPAEQLEGIQASESCSPQPESLQGDPKECIPCPEGCVSCISDAVCLQCDTDWILHSNQHCSRDCEVPNRNNCGDNSTADLCFTGALEADEGGVKLTFSANLTRPLYYSEISVKFYTPDGSETEVDWRLRESFLYWEYRLVFNSSAASEIALTFLDPSFFNGGKCLGLSTPRLTFQLNSTDLNETDGNATSAQQDVQSIQLLASLPVAVTVPIGLTASVLMSEGGQFAWTLFLDLQFESYLPMSTIDIPVSLKKILMSVNPFNLLFNLFTYVNGIGEGDPVDLHLLNGGVDSYMFIENVTDLGTPFGMLFGTALVYALFQKVRFLRTSGKASKKLLEDLPQLLIGSHITISMAVTIQIYGYCYGHWRTSALHIMALVFTILSASVIVFISIFSYSTFMRRLKRFGPNGEHPLFADFRMIDSFGSRGYYVMFSVRRVLFCMSQVFLWRYPTLQGLLAIGHNLWVRCIQFAVYLKLHVRFERRVLKGVQIVSELLAMLVTVLTQLYQLTLTDLQKNQIGHAVIAVLMVKCAVIIICQIENFVGQVKSRAQRKRPNSKVSTDVLQSSRQDIRYTSPL